MTSAFQLDGPPGGAPVSSSVLDYARSLSNFEGIQYGAAGNVYAAGLSTTALTAPAPASRGQLGPQVSYLLAGGQSIDTSARSATTINDRQLVVPTSPDNPEGKIFDHLVALKVSAAEIAMHLDRSWRAGLFRTLDRLLDVDEWDFADTLPSVASFKTFLRMTVFLKNIPQPALGATTDGKIIAGWIRPNNRLTIECAANDAVKWVLTTGVGADRESAAGRTHVVRLPQVLAPYGPERWFGDAIDQHS